MSLWSYSSKFRHQTFGKPVHKENQIPSWIYTKGLFHRNREIGSRISSFLCWIEQQGSFQCAHTQEELENRRKVHILVPDWSAGWSMLLDDIRYYWWRMNASAGWIRFSVSVILGRAALCRLLVILLLLLDTPLPGSADTNLFRCFVQFSIVIQSFSHGIYYEILESRERETLSIVIIFHSVNEVPPGLTVSSLARNWQSYTSSSSSTCLIKSIRLLLYNYGCSPQCIIHYN